MDRYKDGLIDGWPYAEGLTPALWEILDMPSLNIDRLIDRWIDI